MTHGLLTLDAAPPPSGAVALTRVDFNAPIDANGRLTSDLRLRCARPVVEALFRYGARPVLLSHRGRPGGRPCADLSFAPLTDAIAQALGCPLIFATLENAQETLAQLPQGTALLLENTRFDPGETQCCPDFVARLAALGDMFVLDAFASVHRRHASSCGIISALPARAGPALMTELATLTSLIANPAQPWIAIAGGSKITGKVSLLSRLAKDAKRLYVVGAIANAFLVAKGIAMPEAKLDAAALAEARALLARFGSRIVTPIDGLAQAADGTTRALDLTQDVPPGWAVMDIGPNSVARILDDAKQARALTWNGPPGKFETEPFHRSAIALARGIGALAQSNGLIAVAGGGDTAAAIAQAGASAAFTHISTGGGAFLAWLTGEPLPALEALRCATLKETGTSA